MIAKDIPDIVVGRLPRYLQALEHMQRKEHHTTSSQELGDLIGISAAQIRKDLSQYGEFGKQGNGYSVPFLVEQLQKILHVTQTWDMVLVGAGNLGHAIANYQGFANHGFHIKIYFRRRPGPRSQPRSTAWLCFQQPIWADWFKEAEIRLAMLTVPANAAQSVADELIMAGVKSILNYAPIALTVPEDVHVQYIDPIIHLQRMTYYLE